MTLRKTNYLLLLIMLLAGACKNLPEPLAPLPPYEDYLRSLDKADLLKSRLGREWVTAGEKVLIRDSVPLRLPFTTSALFNAHDPEAHGFRFDLEAGQQLSISGKIQSDGRVFTNLFIREDDSWESISSTDSVINITAEFDEFTECLLRIQPELLVTARYSLVINRQPALINPVSGAVNRDIGSVYGDPRDGGNRSHEGVDIFAARGTPVIAPTAGRISRTQVTNLGGKVVWMRDQERGQAYYFAHLDSQLVRSGQWVNPGDTVGLVGNTGNARNTPPHLHFGIYRRGSKDPMSYIRTVNLLEEMAPVDTSLSLANYRVDIEKINLRAGPSTDDTILGSLARHDFVTVLGQSGEWVLVSMPDQTRGWLFGEYLSELESLPGTDFTTDSQILAAPEPNSIAISDTDSTSTTHLAQWENYDYVVTKDGIRGWVEIDQSASGTR